MSRSGGAAYGTKWHAEDKFEQKRNGDCPSAGRLTGAERGTPVVERIGGAPDEEVRMDSAKEMFFPDYTIAVQRQRNSFLAVKWNLREMRFTYSLLFPEKLLVVATDSTHFFTTPEEAWR
ncbi:hypothetical protein NDU88_006099 [Pleurodeles waltl]|uniref:Uncharacterized protein n=1 Tax=Pleurodeles waltl TaxID=8319 RepID=A0AAV7VQF8_PLEWA|nr:hypothetical protein NDU88_006099 [Pleurodeles waltl]